ncbi:hypothetical protein K1719_039996 [Acacia pycnantha]|nr:hypothetical protein K1719_039996 [Acacia pycnantha]
MFHSVGFISVQRPSLLFSSLLFQIRILSHRFEKTQIREPVPRTGTHTVGRETIYAMLCRSANKRGGTTTVDFAHPLYVHSRNEKMKSEAERTRWEGTAHDARVFWNAIETPAMNFPHPPEGKYYLVDAGYPTPVGYIGPYKRIHRLEEIPEGLVAVLREDASGLGRIRNCSGLSVLV